jgi:HK97 family phage portal protein
VTAKELGGSNEASQFLETRQHQVIEVARAFRVPPHMIKDLSRSTYSNIEVQGTEFVQHCLLPHLKRWEAAISRDLIVDDERYFAEHSVMGLMRGASGERAAYYTQMAGLGVLSINDIRELENLNPIGPEGDQRFMNSNMTTIEKIVAQPAPASPTAGA